MKINVNNLKPPKANMLIVGVDMEQKETMKLGSLTIFTGSNYTFDHGVKNPNVAKVYSVGSKVKGIKKGDFVICRHNTFMRWVDIEGGYLYGSLGLNDGKLKLFGIYLGDVLLILDKDGNPRPVPDRLIVDEIVMNRSKIIIDPNPPKHETRFVVKEVGSECEGLRPGMTIECYKHANYTITYHVNNERKEVKLVDYPDVHSIVNV